MGDFSAGFGTGFEIGSIIKEKRKAKKILEQVQNTIQEWKLSGEEPSYVDKVLMSVLLNQAGTSYAASFADIENNKTTMDREKLSQDGMNLRTLNDNGMALLKMIETAAKEGTLGLIDWFQVPKEMFPPDFDLNKFLNKDTIAKLQNDDTRQAALDEVMGITRALPEEYRKGYMEQQGVLEEGLQPTPKEPTALSAKDNWAIENYKTGKISFDQLSKYMGAYIEPEKATELQKKIAEAKQYGATNEEIKKMIVGGTAGGTSQDPNDVLFGTNGIMKNYINSGSQLGEEQKAEIRNNYNLIKPSLTPDVRTQVEDYLKQIGIDLNAPAEALIPEPEPTTSKPSFLGNIWNKITKPGVPPAYKGTPQQKEYTAMNDDELADLALTGDQAAIDELKRRGLL